MLDPRQAFKAGFLARCVADGLALPRIRELAKQAAERTGMLGSLMAAPSAALHTLGKGLDLARPVASGILGYGLPLALAAPPIAGGILGFAGGRATDLEDTDVREIQRREVIDELRRQTERLQRLRESRERRIAPLHRRRLTTTT